MNRFVRCFAVIIASLQLCCALLSTNVLAINNVRILAYGDSLTAGYKLPPMDSYPAQLEALLKKDGYQVEVVNGGVSGDTSAQALARVEWSLKRGPFNYALLCIGANDGLRQLPVAQLEANLKKLVETFKQKNTKVILIGMQMPTNFPLAYRNEFAAIYPRVAKEFKIALYPFFLKDVTQISSLNLDDSIHPNKAGYAIVAKNIGVFLKSILKK